MDGTTWSDFFVNGLDDWFQLAIEASAYAALLAGIVLLINLLFRRWLSAGQMAVLWGLVLARLVMPIVPESRLSLANMFADNTGAESAQLSAQPATIPSAAAPNPVPAYGPGSNVSNLEARPRMRGTPPREAGSWFVAVCLAIPFTWVLVGGGGLAWTLTSYGVFCRRVRQCSVAADARIVRLWIECCNLVRVKRRCRIVRFDGIEQPAIMGVIWPTLLLPGNAIELSDDQLRMVMLHELAHVRRRDVAVNWLLVLIRAIHWWNPVYWLAAGRFRSLREQACDAVVVRTMAGEASQNYGALLLTLLEERPGRSTWRVIVPASILSFLPRTFRSVAVRLRLRALKRAGIRRGKFHAACVAAVMVLLAGSGFTAEKTKEVEPVDLATWMASHPDAVLTPRRSYEVKEMFEGPRVEREYDVSKCLERISKKSPSPDAARFELTSLLTQMYRLDDPQSQGRHESKSAEHESAKAGAFMLTGTKLSVTAPAALHDKLQRALDAWNENGLQQIAVETRFMNADRDLISELGITWQFLEAFSSERPVSFPAAGRDDGPVVRAEARVEEYLPLVVSTLNKQQMEQLIATAQNDRRANVLNAPKITIFNGMEATIADCVQRPFVIGVFQRAAGANEPKAVVLEEGTKISVRAVQRKADANIRLEASLDVRSMGEVATASTSYRGNRVSIQVPKIKRHTVDVAADLGEGQTLLVGFIPTEKQQKYSYYLLSAERIQAAN